MAELFAFLFLLSIIAFCIGLIKPSLFAKIHIASRKKVALVFGISTVVFFILTGVTAQGNSENNPSVTPPPSPTVTKAPISSPTPTPTPIPVPSKPITVTRRATNTPTQPSISVSGFGATVSDWNAHHKEDSRFAVNSSYNPSPDLGDGTRFNDAYYGLNWSDGQHSDSRVVGYSMRLPKGQSQSITQFVVMKEFPSDTTVIWHRKTTTDPTDECYQMEVHSKTLATLLSTPKIGDMDGGVLVEFTTDPVPNTNYTSYYDPQNVNSALLQIGSYTTASDVPGC